MNLSPICLFTYKRLDCTLKTVETLQKNNWADKSNLFVFSDGAKNENDEAAVQTVRKYLDTIKGFKEVNLIKRDRNIGLANSIIQGVAEIINQFGKVIVLEDDLESSPNFLVYMNKALDFYEKNSRVFSIAGYTFPIKFPQNYSYDVYFVTRASSWGWASWKDRWQDIDWEVKDFQSFVKNPTLRRKFNAGGSDMTRMLERQMSGQMDSWAIRWCYHQFKKEQYTAYPAVSKIQNIGFTEGATHTTLYNRYATPLDNSQKSEFNFPEKLILDKQIIAGFKNKYSLSKRIMGRLIHYTGLGKFLKN